LFDGLNNGLSSLTRGQSRRPSCILISWNDSVLWSQTRGTDAGNAPGAIRSFALWTQQARHNNYG